MFIWSLHHSQNIVVLSRSLKSCWMLFMYLEYIPSQKPSRNIVDLNAYILKPDQEAEATV